jgi:PQQ-dependent dehydrogenase (methanol/ethanol family)
LKAVRSAALLGFSLLCACDARVADVDGRRVEAAAPAEWLSNGRTYDEQHYSPLSQIDHDTVGELGLAWWTEVDTDRGQEATPLVVDGVLYTTTAWSKVYALDARTGEELWSYDPRVPGQTALVACCDVVNRGPAIWRGRVYAGTLDGRLIALDARTGALDWEVQTTDPAQAYSITGAPRVVRGKVLIGNGGADWGVRGYVSAYEAESGDLAWRFYTTPNPAGEPDHAASDEVLRETAAATWFDGAWKQTGGGGTVWDAITYDETNDLVLIGVGNGSPWSHAVRSGGRGDNLFLSSIVALQPETGEYVWHYQTTPGETWDYTATQHIMLADLTIDGEARRVVMQAPKNGFFYVLDAATGRLISAEKYIPLDWAERVDLATGRPVENPAARYTAGQPSRQLPGPYGGHNWQAMAFHPDTGLVYIPSQKLRGYYSQPGDFEFLPGVRNLGMGERASPLALDPAAPDPHGGGELIAWDPVAQSARWRLSFPIFWRSGVLATGGGLVFHAVGPEFVAFDAANGEALWRFETTAHAIAPAISYELDGAQYVALIVGYGGAGGITGADRQPRRPGRVLAFKLGGTAQAAPYSEPVEYPALDPALAAPSHGDIAAGRSAYERFCEPCHRVPNFFPNPARSPAILQPEALRGIVLEGALTENGMPSLSGYLDADGVEDVRAFLLTEAARAPTAAPADEPPAHP